MNDEAAPGAVLKVTRKQERFAQAIASGMDKKRAAIAAGYSEVSAAKQASNLLRVRAVARRVAEIQQAAAAAEGIEHTPAAAVAAAWDGYRKAMADKSFSAAATFLKLVMQNLGMLIDRKEIDLKRTVDDAALVAAIAGEDPALAALLRKELGLGDPPAVPGAVPNRGKPPLTH